MKEQRIIVLLFTVLGLICGYLSDYLFSSFENAGLPLAVITPLLICVVSISLTSKYIRGKKKSWMISNTFITFILVWLVIWIFLYNI